MESLMNYICKHIWENKNYIIGIDGGTGAGKTTLTDELSHRLKAIGLSTLTLHIDDFIHKRNIRYDSSKDEWLCFYSLQWRYDYLINEILSNVKNKQSINKYIEMYDKKIDEYKEIKLVVESPYIILLEGVFLQRKELRKFLDYTIFIDVPRNVRD
ncbi:uridine kinase [Gottschalkia acidurici 9a]|uniref:Uridine kinase n=1 Tax=Gottschalkia acidurici (strain ATCC 7906 / DSM 604 / BCRC 14475 / CIP 104303 / KCTC 5404 / NCIMB 10678 / 9a) TaxID=1128398 RepID=K0B1Q3_GOTA9|nr:P-loop NTPase fold protein [Gottschalkia acidurici]AFS79047.1 uridine kinase [Gottschalkia acidurici 9a]